jgi:hypothetical protein
LTLILLFVKIVEFKKKKWVTFLKEQKFVKENKESFGSFGNILLFDMESSKLFYFAARAQQVKLKGKNATHWEHHKEP